MIPLIDLSLDRQLSNKIKKEINRVIDSKSYILGAHLESFEKEFAKFCGTKYAAGVASGTDALRLALRACGIGKGDRVLTVSLTSPFTACAIVEEGAQVVFCDVDKNTLTIDIADAQKRVDHNTRAIIPVHLFGNPCDMQAILEFAQKYKLKIIEDACQAHGASLKNQKVGIFGEAAAFSFYPTKNLGGFGDSGMVTTNDKKTIVMIKSLRNGGQVRRFWHKYQGINSRLDEIQAAILKIKLKSLTINNQKRTMIAKRYHKLLSDLPLQFQKEIDDGISANHLFVIMTNRRDELKEFLNKNGVMTDVYYPYPVHEMPAFSQFANGILKNTEKITREILAIPMFPDLSLKDQDFVIKNIRNFFGK